MREIKFRAWSKVQKKMGNVEGIDFLYDKAYPLIGNVKVGISLIDLQLMQFIGLKDKNGKDIYEGDVVRHRFETYDDYTNYEITFRDCGFSADEIGGIHHMRLYAPTSMEVIGNIYENPELLART